MTNLVDILRQVHEQYKARGNFGHSGRPGKVGGSAPSAGEGGSSAFKLLSSRPGSMYKQGDAELVKAARVGDLGNFGAYGKHYITGRHGNYFTVTKSKSKRFSEPNLSGAIHVSDLKSVTDPDRTWGIAE